MTPEGYPTAFFGDARKFDAGGKPNPVLLPVLRAALEEVAAVDMREAQGRLEALLAPFLEWAGKHGYRFPASHAPHLVGIRPAAPVSTERMLSVASRLEAAHGVVVAVRCGAFRISPYLDNTESDIARLIDALESEAPDLMRV
jgi:selenocysteine lyase/cysteine desulfurase